jgi:hypothetical protein
VIGYMLDTSVAALNLIFSGVVERGPELKICHPISARRSLPRGPNRLQVQGPADRAADEIAGVLGLTSIS